jgi:hypothetical protein
MQNFACGTGFAFVQNIQYPNHDAEFDRRIEMLDRRRFLSSTGLGIMALSSPCRPILAQQSVSDATEFPDDRLESKARLKSKKDRLLGYPINMNTPPIEFFRWRQSLCQAGIGQFSFNNVGNPYKQSPIPYSTHDFERDTISAFAELYGFPSEDVWGFLSNSGTDSNLHGMYIGRTILKAEGGRFPKAYFTRETHYSVQILADLLGMEKVVVATQLDGGMDPDDLTRKLAIHSEAPALIVATIGTTFKGAIDRLDMIRPKVARLLELHAFGRGIVRRISPVYIVCKRSCF